jgi:polyhydroxyalkanoate synthesis regulator phasin
MTTTRNRDFSVRVLRESPSAYQSRQELPGAGTAEQRRSSHNGGSLYFDHRQDLEGIMVDALRKLLLAGLGTIDLTEEKAKAIFNDLVARGEMSEKDAKELVSSWTKRAAEHRGRLQEDIDQAVQRALSAMGIARRAEVEALKAKIDELEAKLGAKDTAVPEP